MQTNTPASNPNATILTLRAEYRSGKADSQAYQGERGMRVTNRAVHRIEVQDQPAEWSQVLPDTLPLNAWTPPAQKGAQVDVTVALVPASVVNSKGMVSKGLYRVRVMSIEPVKTA
jgi:hypothetical protein